MDRRTIAVGDDVAGPAAVRLLGLDRSHALRVDLGDHQGDVRLHPMRRAVREDGVTGLGQTLLDLAGDFARQRREGDGTVQLLAVILDDQIRRAGRHVGVKPPLGRLDVPLARRAIRCHQFGDLEPWVIRKQLDEPLADTAGGPKYRNWNPICTHCAVLPIDIDYATRSDSRCIRVRRWRRLGALAGCFPINASWTASTAFWARRAGTTTTNATFDVCWLEPRTGTPALRRTSIILLSVAGLSAEPSPTAATSANCSSHATTAS